MAIIETRKQGDIWVVDVTGKLMGGPDTKELDENLYKILDDGCKAVIDMGSCEWITASGLGILIHHSKIFRERGGALKLVNPSGLTLGIISTTRLDELFIGHGSIEDAIKSF